MKTRTLRIQALDVFAISCIVAAVLAALATAIGTGGAAVGMVLAAAAVLVAGGATGVVLSRRGRGDEGGVLATNA